MSEIKKGALVKAWDDDAKHYVIGRFEEKFGTLYFVEDEEGFYVNNCFCNAIEIPPELAARLEELGE